GGHEASARGHDPPGREALSLSDGARAGRSPPPEPAPDDPGGPADGPGVLRYLLRRLPRDLRRGQRIDRAEVSAAADPSVGEGAELAGRPDLPRGPDGPEPDAELRVRDS